MNHHISLLILLSLCAPFFQSLMLVKSFRLNLIHRDSPGSPFYNKSSSQSEILVKDAHRSHAQVHIARNSPSMYSKELFMSVLHGGETYLTRYLLGSEQFEVNAFASLKTRFTWTKCRLNNQGEKFFRWSESDTYERVSQEEPACKVFSFTEDPPTTKYCAYKCLADKDVYTNGFIAWDAAYFFESVSKTELITKEYGKILFGCSFGNEGFTTEVQGVFGLGSGTGSVVSVLRQKTKNKFSYCLEDWKDEKKIGVIHFGDLNNRIVESKMTSVPFEQYGWIEIFDRDEYQLHLEGVKVGDNYEKAEPDQLIQIHLGISFTYLPKNIYEKIEDKVTKMFGTDTPPLSGFKICADSKKYDQNSFPKMTFHFSGGAIYELKSSNIFVEDKENEKFCLAIFESKEEISVFGSIAQENHILQFDIKHNRFSFTPPGNSCNSI